ncbi:MAG: carbon-nitrogen family hydrolase [Chloroflexi bacterium]|nr:carbon-nitrogen family hydrolase [Chloroflexota bacterium]
MLTLALIQMEVRDGAVEANRAAARQALAQAARQGARWALLPEMWTTGFDPAAITAQAEPFPHGPTLRAMRGWATEYDLWISGSLPIRAADGRRYNAAVTVGPRGQVLPPYRKIHLFRGMHEDQVVSPGCAPQMWTLPWGRVGVLVCYDLRFPELARGYALRGADALVVLGAWPAARRDHWDLLLRARAVENLLFVLAVNRVGPGRYGPFGGGSAVVDPWGQVLAQAHDAAQVLTVRVDLAATRQRRAAFPALADRRPECYGRNGKADP